MNTKEYNCMRETGKFINGIIYNGIRQMLCGCYMVGAYENNLLLNGEKHCCDGTLLMGEFNTKGDLIYGSYTRDGISYIGEFKGGMCKGKVLLSDKKYISGVFAMKDVYRV